jgi:hypothetical protein
MLGISAATGSRVAPAPTKMPAIAASPAPRPPDPRIPSPTTSAANSPVGPQMIRSRANTNWRNTLRRSMSAIGAACSSTERTWGARRHGEKAHPAARAPGSTAGSASTRIAGRLTARPETARSVLAQLTRAGRVQPWQPAGQPIGYHRPHPGQLAAAASIPGPTGARVATAAAVHNRDQPPRSSTEPAARQPATAPTATLRPEWHHLTHEPS